MLLILSTAITCETSSFQIVASKTERCSGTYQNRVPVYRSDNLKCTPPECALAYQMFKDLNQSIANQPISILTFAP